MRYHLTPVRMAIIKKSTGTSLAVQWLPHHASNAGGTGLIPGQGTRIPQAAWGSKKKKKKSLQITNAGEGMEKREHSDTSFTDSPSIYVGMYICGNVK